MLTCVRRKQNNKRCRYVCCRKKNCALIFLVKLQRVNFYEISPPRCLTSYINGCEFAFIIFLGSTTSPATTAATTVSTTSPTPATSLWLRQHHRYIPWPRFGQLIIFAVRSLARLLARALKTNKQKSRQIADGLFLPYSIHSCCTRFYRAIGRCATNKKKIYNPTFTMAGYRCRHKKKKKKTLLLNTKTIFEDSNIDKNE